jgi:PAS domain S-box-containing protein
LTLTAENLKAAGSTLEEARKASFRFELNAKMNEVRTLISKIQQEETTLRRVRQAEVTRQFYQFAFTFFGLVILALVFLGILAYALNLNLKASALAGEKLRRAASSIHDLYENAPCGYFSINTDGIFNDINETLLKWLGYRKEEVTDRLHINDVLTDNLLYDESFSIFQDHATQKDLEFKMVRKDKSIVPVIINATAIAGPNGKYGSIRCSLFDNTERKKAEEATRVINKELEAFSYSVSHDLRAPLRSINGYAQILIEDYEEKLDDEGKRIVKTLINNAKRMGQLIDDLLDFSRIGRKELTKANVDMHAFVKGLLEELLEPEKGRDVRIDLRPLGTSWVDLNLMRQVWINLLSNALKYSRKKSFTSIEIGATRQAGEVLYYVKDNGAGFSMDYAHKLFGVFQRLHKESEFEGTGVGLALVKRIVERHEGRVWAESVLNEGSTFFFSIPNQTRP